MLWNCLRGRQCSGFKFRRQHPVGPYFADFCCIECALIIEADGDSHEANLERDGVRDRFLAANGFAVLRFPNEAILEETEGVIEAIRAACNYRKQTGTS